MTTILNDDQRRHLDKTIQRARTAAERAAADALQRVSVAELSRPAYLTEEYNRLRLALRAKARQLGDNTAVANADLSHLRHDVAYEQWHRLLFARFLERNGLLRHPEYRDVSVTIDECADLAGELDEPDAWSVAARFASQILPGVFRLDDPAVRIRLATEHRLALEKLLLAIPSDVFLTEDALGWVYQFWQTAEKKRVNESGDKIGASNLSPVTQLFTENYMVRFLLENSLGAWWAGRHPESPLIESWDYLRRLDDGTPAAGIFDEWPKVAAEITVMDPACGSGHFLTAMFGMLWRMRAEEESLSPVEAQDAVLRDNLHGLELDPRCTQIATFNVAIEAWRQGGYRDLPAPQIACSGVSVRAPLAEWQEYAGEDEELKQVLTRLHGLFRNADTLGSLIAPRADDLGGALFGRDMRVETSWETVRRTLAQALDREDVEGNVLGDAADNVVHAAELLSRTYTLVMTNPPFLGLERMSHDLATFAEAAHTDAKRELATTVFERSAELASDGGTLAFVIPSEWTFIRAGRKFRKFVLHNFKFHAIAALGDKSFRTPLRVSPWLMIASVSNVAGRVSVYDVSNLSISEKALELQKGHFRSIDQETWKVNTDSRLSLSSFGKEAMQTLGDIADAKNGMSAGDGDRFERKFWELQFLDSRWQRLQSSPSGNLNFDGMSKVVIWENEGGAMFRLAQSVKHLNHAAQNWRRGKPLWGRRGIVVSQIGARVGLYLGDRFDSSCFAVVPNHESDLLKVAAFGRSGSLAVELSKINPAWKLGSPKTLLQLPIDDDSCEARVDELFGDGFPAAHSDDPTQWLFEGAITASTEPLQVAMARLLGYGWPDQEPDCLDGFADSDGIAALVGLPGEQDLATRLRTLLAAAYGGEWSNETERKLVVAASEPSGDLEKWLRNKFFAHHVKVFQNRPFLWHIWDGHKDGFSAVVNYHRLDHARLEKLTYTTLGAWIERQRGEVASDVAGADVRLAAARELQRKLTLILEGAPPYDVYVRWKEMHGQSIGWHPDLDDGVRMNIRPFVTAGVLRAKVNVNWGKDRGKNPDGSERINDLHPTLEERQAARDEAEREARL